jgi:hypothetical protein
MFEQHVKNFFNKVANGKIDSNGRFVGSSKSSTGYLYVTGNAHVQVVLPIELIDYANAASGNMPGRPVGIRTAAYNTIQDAADAVAAIFESPETLAKFIRSSECDAEFDPVAYETAKRRGLVRTFTDERPANDAWTELYQKWNMKELAERFGRDTVIQARKLLTVNEFELRFGN